jgi:hypothetical protein
MTTEQRPPGRIRLVEATWCDICEKKTAPAAHFNNYAAGHTVDICPSCLREALALVGYAAVPATLLDRACDEIERTSAGKEREP